MDAKTHTVLDNAGPDTRHILIYGDTTLSKADLSSKIVKVLGKYPKIESLTISGCALKEGMMGDLAASIAAHPSLVKIDFSRNKFSSLAWAAPILIQSKTIHTIDISQNLEEVWPSPSYESDAFVLTLIKSDSVASAKLSKDYFFSWHKDGLEKLLNLVEMEIDLQGQSGNERKIEALCRRNKTEARSLLNRIRENDIHTIEDVENINRRLPAILFLAEATSSRKDIIQKLRGLNQTVLAGLGVSFGLELYTTEADKTPLPSASDQNALPATVLPSLPNIRDVSDKIPVLSEEDIRNKLEEGKDDPAILMNLGQDVIAPIGQISFASLLTATSGSSMEAPVRSMADFLNKFGAAKKIISEQIDLSENASGSFGSQHQTKSGALFLEDVFRALKLGPVWDKFFGRAQELNDLADAGVLSREAGQILLEMLPALSEMEKRVSIQLSDTQQIIDSYEKVAGQLCLIGAAGTQTLDTWRKEERGTVTILPPNAETGPTAEPRHIEELALRLDFLKQTELQVIGHASLHKLHSEIERKQQQGLIVLQTQNIPTITEQVATFMRQVEDLQRASVINSLADATRETARDETGTSMLAAVKTAQAIENLALSTKEIIANMGKAADENTKAIESADQRLSLPTAPEKTLTRIQNDRKPS
ncbi:MAG: hypothetical protein PHE27_01335 [Alphaproteobacteria bacterium]|nr:hypothetical protein [Alphaproteobacteria bacterium]